jgi:predicted protein tyrosine phosphatase
MENEVSRVVVWSKPQFNSVMQKLGLDDSNIEGVLQSAFISINDTQGSYSTSWFNSDHSNVLILWFDDVETDLQVSPTNNQKCRAFTEEQGKKIIEFIEKNKDRKQIVVHCSAGISRSGAVGLFINDYFHLNHEEFRKINPWTSPNAHVSRILNNLMRCQQ